MHQWRFCRTRLKCVAAGPPARSRTVGCTRNGTTFLVSMLLSLKIDGNTKHLQIDICHVSSTGPGVGCSRSNHLQAGVCG